MDEYGHKTSSMFGAFNLRENTDFPRFKSAFDSFCNHLKDEGYLASWRLWERAYHDGYDTRFPDASVVLEMCFQDHQTALDAWDYIESKEEPMHGLHKAMNAQITDTYFVLCNEYGPDLDMNKRV
jgi:hypothetical protein